MKFTNIFSRLLAVFGIVLLLGVSGWGSCGTSNGSWTPSSTAQTGSVTNSAEYYTILVPSSGILNISVQNTYTGGSTRTLTATLYPDNGQCTTTSLWNNTIVKNSTRSSGNISVTAGTTYTLKLVSSSSNNTGYSLTGSIPLPPIVTSGQQFNVNPGTTAGTQIGTVATTGGTPTNFSIASGNTGSIFSIDRSGLISVASTVPTTPTSYTLSVTASNNAGTSTAQNVTIAIVAIPTVDSGRSFAIRNPLNTQNITGGIAIIGNTVLCDQDSHGNCIDYNNNDGQQLSNSQLNLKYVDVDGNSSTYDSSQAKLSIPSTATVVWAGLYTQGYMNGQSQSQSTNLLQQNPTYLTIPSIGTVSSYPSNIDFYSNGSSGYTYDTYAPVPQLIGKAASVVNGWVTGANIQTYTGTDNSGLGNYGAWTLVVVYSDPNSTLKNISVFDGYKKVANQTGYSNVTVPVSGFLTPTSGAVNSTLSLFVGEGDKYITGDKLSLNGTYLNSTNAFYSVITGVTDNPSFINNEGIDIQNFDVGVDGNSSHPQIIGNGASNANITMTTTQDTFFPSMVAFTTELYTPSLCYYQSFLDVNGNPLSNPKKGDTITIATWFSDMQKNSNSADLETALKVQVGMSLDTKNLQYVINSTNIKNIGASNYSTQTDSNDTDLTYFNGTSSVANWNLGTNANSSSGGTFNPNPNGANSLKAYVTYKATIQQDGNISINNQYNVSYVNGVTQALTSNVPLKLCADINTSIGVEAATGIFNVVYPANFTGNTDPLSSTDPKNALPTQIVGKPFQVQVLSLAADLQTLQAYSANDVNVTMIVTPDYSQCSDDTCKSGLCEAAIPITTWQQVPFNDTSSALMNFTYSKAIKNASFKIQQGSGTNAVYVCSRDVFAVRPDRFILTAPTGQDIGLLKSGIVYNFSLLAAQYNSSLQSLDYNVSGITNTNGLLSLNPTLYNIHGNPDSTLHGTLSLSTNSFDIQNGLATNVVDMSFDDVAKVDMQVIDKTWAQVDITNGDTPANCTGAWICGDTNATFIPDHFALSGVGLYNNNNTGFTYLSDDLNMSARVGLTVTAQNALSATTQNFSSGSWENPVNIYLTVPTISGLTSIKHDINSTIDLGFNHGALTIPWNETNSSQQLLFNFKRDVNSPKNPFFVLGSNIDLNSSSLYTSSSSNTANISGSNVATQDATFLYGRTFAPRYRFTGNNGNANIFYEAYCGSDGNKSMLPTGSIGDSSSVGWYLNVNHNAATDGKITAITEKNLTNTVTNSSTLPLSTSNGVSTATLIYHGTTFPYKTTMQDTASSWLIYNPDNSSATTNDFQVEFYGGSNNWTGHNNNTTTTDSVAAPVTSKRILW